MNRHKYYYDPKQIDLSVLRAEATKQSNDQRFGSPTPVVIHWHDAGDECAGKQHEQYVEGEEVPWVK